MNAIATSYDCATGDTPFHVALERVLGLVAEPLTAEYRTLRSSVGCALAESFYAQLSLPAFHQSAMDGYAVHCAALAIGTWLPVTGRTTAGERPGFMAEGGVHRILTGAPLPFSADAVIAQESVEREGDLVRVAMMPPIGANVRHRGEDIQFGDELVAAGTTLDWRHVALLAAQGVSGVQVRRRPRVTLLSSGRELRSPGESLTPGQVYDSNNPMLAALLSGWGARVCSMPILENHPVAIRRALKAAAEEADVILTTAGISVGDEDYVRDVLGDLGDGLSLLKVAMKPGKLLAAGRLGGAAFVGLPGNPMAALAGAVGFVRPMLARLVGKPVPQPLQAYAAFEMRHKPGQTEFIPVRLRQSDFGLWADRSGPDGSGRLSPLLTSTGFALLPAAETDVRCGVELEILPFLETSVDPKIRNHYDCCGR